MEELNSEFFGARSLRRTRELDKTVDARRVRREERADGMYVRETTRLVTIRDAARTPARNPSRAR